MLKIGVCGDMHGDFASLKTFFTMLPKETSFVVILGDIVSDEHQEDQFHAFFSLCKESGFLVYVIPGNYEDSKTFTKIFSQYQNEKLINAAKKIPFQTKVAHQTFVFIPGADVLGKHGSYLLVENEAEAIIGKQRFKKRKVTPVILEKFSPLLNSTSIVFSHAAPRVSGSDGIDVATFGKADTTFSIEVQGSEGAQPFSFSQDDIISNTAGFAEELVEMGAPVTMHQKHVGPKWYTSLLKKKGIKIVVCGHIHDRGGVATNFAGKLLKEQVWQQELLYNVGALQDGLAGYVEIEGKKARYRRIFV